MYANIRDVTLYYEIHGKGDPLICLPGGPGGDHTIYKKTHMGLSAYNQLILFDPRGCGNSSTSPVEDYTIENYVEDVEELRKYLKLDKINLLGKSYGGMVAQHYALIYPDSINKIIFVATSTSHHAQKEAVKNLESRGTPEQIKIGKKLLNGTFKDQADIDDNFAIMRSLYSDAAKGKSIDEIKSEDNPKLSFEPFTYGFKTFIRTYNFEPMLKNILHHALVIGGDHDWVCDPKYSKILAEKLPNATLLILDAGHSIDCDQPKQYFQAIKVFLERDKMDLSSLL